MGCFGFVYLLNPSPTGEIRLMACLFLVVSQSFLAI